MEAGGIGLGANIGMMYEFNERHRLGLSYKHSPNIDAKGDIHFAGESYDSLAMPLRILRSFPVITASYLNLPCTILCSGLVGQH